MLLIFGLLYSNFILLTLCIRTWLSGSKSLGLAWHHIERCGHPVFSWKTKRSHGIIHFSQRTGTAFHRCTNFPQIWSQLTILGARNWIWKIFLAKLPKILDATIQNIVARATRHPGFVNVCDGCRSAGSVLRSRALACLCLQHYTIFQTTRIFQIN